MKQYNTTNLSFLKMTYILKEFGIKNNNFFLELYDEELFNIDPFREDLDLKTQIRIHNEISKNPWYFLREIARIPVAGEKRRIELTRGTLAISWSVINNISAIVVLPRQCYKTYTVAALYLWFFYWGCTNTDFMLFSYSDAILQGNLQRIKELRDNLPSYLNLYKAGRDKDNSREMRYQTNNFYNHIRIKAPPQSPDEAVKAGRGFSTPIMWYDEVNFITNIDKIYGSSTFAYKTIAEIAKKNNAFHHRLMTSSVGFLDREEGMWGFNFINSSADYTEKMFDYPIETVKEMISKNSTNNFLHIEFMYYDLGKSDNYLEEMKKDSIDETTFNREVLNKWLRTEGIHPLGKVVVDLLLDNIVEPSEVLVINDVYFLKLYKSIEEIDFNKQYVMGVDCGGNLLQDFSVITIVDPSNFETIGVLRSNSYSTNRFAKAIVNIMKDIFTNSILVMERNNMGIAIIDYITENNFLLAGRVYYDENDKPGFATTKQSRYLLLNVILKTVVTYDYKLLHDSHIINEIASLVIKNGRIDHPDKGHDDTLMSYLFTRWFLMYAKNKNKYIDPNIIGIESAGRYTDDISFDNAEKNKLYKKIYEESHNMSNSNNFLNQDGTINRNMNNNFDFGSGESVSDTMERIRENLFSHNNSQEHKMTRLNDKEMMLDDEDEEVVFNRDPEKIKEETKDKGDNLVKTQIEYNISKNDFKRLLSIY